MDKVSFSPLFALSVWFDKHKRKDESALFLFLSVQKRSTFVYLHIILIYNYNFINQEILYRPSFSRRLRFNTADQGPVTGSMRNVLINDNFNNQLLKRLA